MKYISGWYIFTTGNIYESFQATKIRWDISDISLEPYIYTISSEPIPQNVDLTASSWFKYSTSSNVSLPPNKSFWVKLPSTQVSDDWNIRKDDSIIDSILYDNALWSASLSSDGTILTSHLTATDASINHLTLEDASINHLTVEDASINHLTVEDASINNLTVEDASINHLFIEDASINHLTVEDASINHLFIEDASINHLTVEDASINHLTVGGSTYITNNVIILETGNIRTNEGYILTKVGDIITNNGNIRTTIGNLYTNNGNLYTNNGDIYTEEGDISTRNGGIKSISGNIYTINGNLYTNNGNLYTNNGNIRTTIGNLYTNNGDIYTEEGDIKSISGDIYTEEGDIYTEEGDIFTSNGNISTINGKISIGNSTNGNTVLMYPMIEPRTSVGTNAGVFKIVYPFLRDDGSQFFPNLYKVVVFAKTGIYTYVTDKADGSHPTYWHGTVSNNHGELVLDLKQGSDIAAAYNNGIVKINDWLNYYSDDRLKHQEVPIDNGLYLINQVKTEFYKKTREMKESNYMGDISGEWWWERGVIAQDLLKTDFSYCVHTPSFPEAEPYSVKYHDLFVANIAATQELHKLVLEQQKEINDLKQQVSRIDNLENKINTLLQN